MQHKITTFWLIGGDLRNHWLARYLAEDGNQVHTFALDCAFLGNHENITQETNLDGCHRGSCVIFPLPMTNNEGNLTAPFHKSPLPLSQILDKVTPSQTLLGGQITPLIETLANPRSLTIQDYLAREELTIANAIPTAEGALQIAMERLPTTIHRANILILGYGYVGKATAKAFDNLGANVTVSARRTAPLAQAQADNFTPLPLHKLPEKHNNFSCIINTIPSEILGETELKSLPQDALLIDLASGKGGINQKAADKRNRTIIHALSLPGKIAPATAAKAIQETIYNMLEEQT